MLVLGTHQSEDVLDPILKININNCHTALYY